MATTYSDRLRISLIGNGEQSGTWGNTTNTNLGSLVEEAIAGVVTIAMGDANYTLSVANGATDEARQAVLVVTGSLSTMRDLICPAEEKVYIVKNGTTGGQSVRLKTSSGSGVIIPNGQTTLLYCDGTNVSPAVDTLPGNSWINGTLLVSGATSLDNTVVINDSGGDRDFRVEGDTNANLLFTDASTDRVGIGTGTPAARLHVLSADGVTNTRLSGASYALRFQPVAATGAVLDATDSTEATYQPLLIGGSDVRLTISGTEQARLSSAGNFGIGTNSPSVRLDVSGDTSLNGAVVINEAGADKDFRVEGDTNANLLFVDASTDRVGIGTDTPACRLHVVTGDGGTNTRFAGASYALRFQSIASTGAVLEATNNTEASFQPLLIGGSITQFTISGAEKARITTDGNLLVGATASTNGKVYGYADGTSASHGIYGETLNKTASGFYGVYGRTSVGTAYGSGGVIGVSRDATTYGISGYWDGTTAWSFYGNASALTSGTWQTSDSRLKDNVQDLSGAASLVSSLRPVAFDWKPDSDAARAGFSHDFGLIAQEVLPVLPEIVREVTAPPSLDSENPSLNSQLGTFYTIEYSRLIPHLIAAVKELKAELDVVKAELETLKGA